MMRILTKIYGDVSDNDDYGEGDDVDGDEEIL